MGVVMVRNASCMGVRRSQGLALTSSTGVEEKTELASEAFPGIGNPCPHLPFTRLTSTTFLLSVPTVTQSQDADPRQGQERFAHPLFGDER